MKIIPILLFAMLACASVSHAQTIYFVNAATGNDTNPGSSWATPFRNVTRAVAAANASAAAEVQIWVAEGIYTPTDGIATLPTDIKDTSFTFYRGNGVGRALKVYGGFAGTEATVTARDTVHPTYLDGILGSLNSYHIVVIAGLASGADSVVIDGFTIRNGGTPAIGSKTYNGVSILRNGGGGICMINNFSPRTIIRGCKIRTNTVQGNNCATMADKSAYGGGIYSSYSQVAIHNSIITQNIAKGRPTACTSGADLKGAIANGGALYADTSDITIVNSVFDANQALGGNGPTTSQTGGIASGGGIYFARSVISISGSTFNANIARGGAGSSAGSGFGGGCYFFNCSPNVSNSTYSNNRSFLNQNFNTISVYGSAYGGGVCNIRSSGTFSNCTFYGNAASDSLGYINAPAVNNGVTGGGAVYNRSSNPSFLNCTLTANKTVSNYRGTPLGGGFFNDTCAPVITNCIISDNTVKSSSGPNLYVGGGGIANRRAAPTVTNCTIKRNACTNSSSPSEIYGAGVIDLAGSTSLYYNCSITNNYFECSVCVVGFGGGGAVNASSPVFRKCRIDSNLTYGGAGMYISSSQMTIDSCSFSANNASTGGALYLYDAQLAPTNTKFTGNRASRGGAIVMYNNTTFKSIGNYYGNNKGQAYGGAIISDICATCTDTMVNNVFAGNTTTNTTFPDGRGGALVAIGGRHTISNNTFFADTASTRGGAIRLEGTGANYTITNNIFNRCYGATTSTDTSITGASTFNFANNMYSATDAMFVTPTNVLGTDGLHGTSDDGLRLQICSPGVNTGSNAYVSAAITLDAAGNPRINGPQVDKGAYETMLVQPITGPAVVCRTNTIALADATGSGTWSSSDASVATVSSTGVVTGVNQGSAVISYSVSFGCISSFVTKLVTVERTAAAIVGPNIVCVGSGISLTDTTLGGSWSVGAPSIASVSSAGLVTGLTQGTAAITYSVTNICGTSASYRTVTVERTAAAILGADSICLATTTTLTDTTIGGTWSSSAPLIASISGTDLVSGHMQGTATISYIVTNSCGTSSAWKNIKIQRTAAAIVGIDSVCTGDTITLSDTTLNGTWSSGSPLLATVDGAGLVIGMAHGTSIISYIVTNSCGTTHATKMVKVQRLAAPITGSLFVCEGSVTTLSDTALGGTWASGSPLVATISSSGVVNGIAKGTSIITYALTNACGSSSITATVTVQRPASIIVGPDIVCVGGTIALTDSTVGGTWASSNIAIASVSSVGNVTGVMSGTASITYTVSNSCGPTSAVKTVTVEAMASPLSGPDEVCEHEDITLTNLVAGGSWSSSDVAVAAVSGGVVSGVAAGTATISYAVTNACGASAVAKTITVVSATICHPDTYVGQQAIGELRVYPNPAVNTLTIEAPMRINARISTVDGRMVAEYENCRTVDISNFPTGILLLTIYDETGKTIVTKKVLKPE